MLYGLSGETIRNINHVFESFKEVEEAVLYGSRAKGNYKRGSDIDIALKGKNLNLHSLNKISLNLDDLLLPYTIDIAIYHQINNPDLIEHIKQAGKVFYKKAKENITTA